MWKWWNTSFQIFWGAANWWIFYLISGSMICVGRSNYFRFNHPEEAERMKTILPTSSRISSVPMSNMMSQDGPGESFVWGKTWHEFLNHIFDVFSIGMDNPEYFHMAGVNGGNSAFQPVRSSSPQYIGELHFKSCFYNFFEFLEIIFDF